MDINVRIDEGCAAQPELLWDSVWDPLNGFADWQVAQPNEPLNAGGLRAMRPLDTAVILAFFTDKACPPNHPLAPPDGDLRGWWGDGVDVRADLGETDLGSLFWLLERQILDPNVTPRWAVAFGLDALAPIIAQGAAAKAAVQAFAHPPSRLDVAAQLYGQNGELLFNQRYNDIWSKNFSPIPALASGGALYDAPTLDFSNPADSQLMPAVLF